MVSVYQNHRHIERRMRNLKSDLPIRPLYVHRDEVIIPLCFVCVLALMVYTLIERDCQTNPALRQADLTTTDRLLIALGGYCLTVFDTSSGYQLFWFDTPSDTQSLIWTQFGLPNPGESAPIVHPTRLPGEKMSVCLLILVRYSLLCYAENKLDLVQIHGAGYGPELADAVLAPGGILAQLEAIKAEGLLRFIGFTSEDNNPAVYRFIESDHFNE